MIQAAVRFPLASCVKVIVTYSQVSSLGLAGLAIPQCTQRAQSARGRGQSRLSRPRAAARREGQSRRDRSTAALGLVIPETIGADVPVPPGPLW